MKIDSKEKIKHFWNQMHMHTHTYTNTNNIHTLEQSYMTSLITLKIYVIKPTMGKY